MKFSNIKYPIKECAVQHNGISGGVLFVPPSFLLLAELINHILKPLESTSSVNSHTGPRCGQRFALRSLYNQYNLVWLVLHPIGIEDIAMRKPSIATGVLIGLLLTAPLISVLYLVNQSLGLAFVPFEFLIGKRQVAGQDCYWRIEILSRTLILLGSACGKHPSLPSLPWCWVCSWRLAFWRDWPFLWLCGIQNRAPVAEGVILGAICGLH